MGEQTEHSIQVNVNTRPPYAAEAAAAAAYGPLRANERD